MTTATHLARIALMNDAAAEIAAFIDHIAASRHVDDRDIDTLLTISMCIADGLRSVAVLHALHALGEKGNDAMRNIDDQLDGLDLG